MVDLWLLQDAGRRRARVRRGASVGGLVLAAGLASGVQSDPWADQVIGYEPGAGPVPGFDDPQAALGSPERFTGEGSGFPGVVSPFNPPFDTNEIVSIGEGGHLTLAFDEPIRDRPGNRFGVDLIVFGNGGFIDTDFPAGRVGSPPGTFGFDSIDVEVSADGDTFVPLGSFTEGLFPTLGFADSGAFDSVPGSLPTDFTRPVDPSLTLDDFAGRSLPEIVSLYDGSGGGTPIDISGSGLSEVSFMRISVADDGDAGTALNAEIDAIATVPAPGVTAFGWAAWMVLGGRRRRR